MSEMIPTEAARAAVKAAKESFGGEVPRGMRAAVHAALEAAAPHLRPISAADIEAVADMIKAAAANGWDEGRKHGATYPYGERGLGADDNPYRSQS